MNAQSYPVGRFASEFTGDEPFLADHVIKGRKILPGVVYLEMSRSAIALSLPIEGNRFIELADSVFVLPMVVTGPLAVETLVFPGAPGEFGIEVRTEQGVHFQSKAFLRDLRKEGAPARLDFAALEARCPTEGPDGRTFYAGFARKGINLGSSLRGIQSIRLGSDCSLVSAELPASDEPGMALVPGMLDSFIQSGDVFSTDSSRLTLPFAVMRTRIYGNLVGRMRAFVTRTPRGLDYSIADESGEVKVVINDFTGRELESHEDQCSLYLGRWTSDEEALPTEGGATTLLSGQESYEELARAVLAATKEQIEAKSGSHRIEVRIPRSRPSWLGIESMLKTVVLEHPRLSYAILVDGASTRLAFEPAPAQAGREEYAWPNDKTILITGGMGGLGRLIAQDISANTRGCTLVLAGRTAPDAEGEAFLETLRSMGANAVFAHCDVSNRDQVHRLVADYPEIAGVVHASGILRDGLIAGKGVSDLDQVLAPKVGGITWLDEATASLPLEFFIALSSIAAALGNSGQADYAAANGFMDAFMVDRARKVEAGERRGTSLSVDWPIWAEGGMKLDDESKRALTQTFRIKPLPTAIGLTALRRLLAVGHPHALVLYGNAKATASMMERRRAPAKAAAPTAKADVAVDSEVLVREILAEIRQATSAHLKRRPEELGDQAEWSEFGFDSILLSSFANRVNSMFDLALMPSIFFEATSMRLFSQYLAENHGEQMARKLSIAPSSASSAGHIPPKTAAPVREREAAAGAFEAGFRRSWSTRGAHRDKDVAIIGMSCRTAGARNPDEFWQILSEARDMISEIPSDRWDWRDYPGVSKWGSFVDGVDEFDPLFFGISPAEALYMAPEQRMMMQYVWECLEDAGYAPDSLKGTSTGLFIGCGPSGYSHFLSRLPIEAYSATGMVPSVGPNRISYMMDWHGPSNPIETACSSALVAVHRAVEAIRAGHCEQAIAGGVNLLLSPDGYISFSKSGMLCEDGRCKSFSSKANGYVRGEGIGMLLLKPLGKAIQDGDTIHAIVKGTSENHGGKGNSLTAPNPKAQTAVVLRALRDAEMDFARVGYIECHGTGTSLGDPVEIKGLKGVAAEMLGKEGCTTPERPCKLGSVKSNIGHLEFAAGAVGLIKVILMMKHKRICKSLHCDEINPYIELGGTPFSIAQEECDWEVDSGRARVAGVSSFGFGGVNSHVILEEYLPPDPADTDIAPDDRTHLIVASAHTEESLLAYAAKLPDYIRTLPRDPRVLERIAHTSRVGRNEMRERVAFVVRSVDEWSEQVEAFLQSGGRSAGRKSHRGSLRSDGGQGLDLGDTRAGREFLAGLAATGEYGKLAELWVKGARIDWNLLGSTKPRTEEVAA